MENENGMKYLPVSQAENALAQVEQSRAVAEVQASIVLARANPRNEEMAQMKIMNACKRKSLAEQSAYSFKRGTSLIEGASIRLVEVIARYWGNLNFGFREVGRGEGYSEVEAFAHDLETNNRVTRQFQARHWRDTKSGGYAIKEERDKYELVANMAQRRVRACLVGIIPGDIVESARDACTATIQASIGDTQAATEKIIKAFSGFDVTPEMIESHLQRKLRSIVPADIVNLRRIYQSIKDGIAGVDEFFDKSASDLEDKILEPQVVKADIFPCPVEGCDLVSTSKSGLTRHMNSAHPQPEVVGPEPDAEPPWTEDPEDKEPVTMITDDQLEQMQLFIKDKKVLNDFTRWYLDKPAVEFTKSEADIFILNFDDEYSTFRKQAE